MKKAFVILLALLLLVSAMPTLAVEEQTQDPLELLAMQSPHGVRQVVAGGAHTVAILNDGSLWAWGSNSTGQLGSGQFETVRQPGWSFPTRIGINSYVPIQIGTDTNWASIAAGDTNTVAIRTDGSLWEWGAIRYRYDGTPSGSFSPVRVGTATNWASVATDGSISTHYNVAIRTDGSLWEWGYAPVPSIGSSGFGTSHMPVPTPRRIGTATNFTSVSVGNHGTYAVAIRADGTLWAWGGLGGSYTDANGTLRHITIIFSTTPVQVGTSSNWASVSACRWHIAAIQRDGSLWAWGLRNLNFNPWGDGWIPPSWEVGEMPPPYAKDSTYEASPIRIGTDTTWASVAVGGLHTIAIRTDGSLSAWGGAFSSTTPVHGTSTDWTSVSTLGGHIMLTRTDGSLWGLGSNWTGQLGDGTRTDAPTQRLIFQPTTGSGTPAPPQTPPGSGTPTPPQTPPPGSSLPFTDIQPTARYYNAIRHVFEQDIMRGTSETAFSPNETLTRAMVATILHRMADEPHTTFRPLFNDVVAGRWYSLAVTWANDTEIVQGVGSGRFAPNDLLTREQLSAMMHRFARYRGLDLSVPSHITAPSGTSQWAQHYVRWAVYHNFIPTTNPSAAATRAETAIFVHQFDLRLGN